MSLLIVFVLACLVVVTSQTDVIRTGYYGLIGRDETLAEITYIEGTVRNRRECAEYCLADGDCFTFVHGGNQCGWARLWAGENDPVTIIPTSGYLVYTVYECDVTAVPCAQVQVNRTNYTPCDGVYDLVPGLWQYQRPVYYMLNIDGWPRYLRFMHQPGYNRWIISSKLPQTNDLAFQISHITRTCHPAESSPWQTVAEQTIECL